MPPRETEDLGGEDHLALVARVKAVQRDSDQGRNQWHNFCDTSGKGTRDPSRHTASFIRSFFEALRDGTIPQGLEALHEKPLPELGDDPKDALPILVAKVKHGQRTSVEFKEKWWNYADTQHDGIRDPSKHDVASLRRFIAEVAPAGGTLPTGMGGEAPPQLAERVKQMQRQSEQVKQQWWWYCDTFGAGVRDPNRHQEAFLQQFLTMAEAQNPGVAAAGYGKAPDANAYRYSPYDQSYAAAAAAAQAYAAYPGYAQACGTPGYPAAPVVDAAFGTTPAAAYGAVPAYGTPPAAAAAAAAYGAAAAAYPSAYGAYGLPAPGMPGMPGLPPLYGAAGAPALGAPALPGIPPAALPGMDAAGMPAPALGVPAGLPPTAAAEF